MIELLLWLSCDMRQSRKTDISSLKVATWAVYQSTLAIDAEAYYTLLPYRIRKEVELAEDCGNYK